MKAWFRIRKQELARCEIALVVDVGETGFSGYGESLGAPAARYFEKGGRECARQWIVRRKANPILFRSLWRQLRDVGEGDVRQVVGRMLARRAA